MRLSSLIATVLGLALAIGLVVVFGAADLGGLVLSGWPMVLLASAFRVMPLALDAFAWNHLFAPPDRRPAGFMLKARWICESVNTLLPVAQVGGDVVRARLASRPFPLPDGTSHGGGGGGASVLVDYLFGQVTLALFIILAVVLLILRGVDGASSSQAASGDWEVVALAALLAILLSQLLLIRALKRNVVQRLAARVSKLGGPAFAGLGGGAERMDQHIADMLSRRQSVFVALAVKMVAHLVRAVEVWGVLLLLGQPVTPAEALIIEGFVAFVRAAGFMVPGALGLQEGGIVAVGALIGVPAGPALAFALIRRGREVLTSLPGVVAWAREEEGAVRRLLRTLGFGRGPGPAPEETPPLP